MKVWVVSHTQINDDNEIDYCEIDKVFSYEKKNEAFNYARKRESETWGTSYDVDEKEVE